MSACVFFSLFIIIGLWSCSLISIYNLKKYSVEDGVVDVGVFAPWVALPFILLILSIGIIEF